LRTPSRRHAIYNYHLINADKIPTFDIAEQPQIAVFFPGLDIRYSNMYLPKYIIFPQLGTDGIAAYYDKFLRILVEKFPDMIFVGVNHDKYDEDQVNGNKNKLDYYLNITSNEY